MKKEVLKIVLNAVVSVIVSLAALFGITSCSGLDIECSGSWCVKHFESVK